MSNIRNKKYCIEIYKKLVELHRNLQEIECLEIYKKYSNKQEISRGVPEISRVSGANRSNSSS